MPNKVTLFAVIALAMLAVPGWMIVKHERILRDGNVYKFRTAPVDPLDPFRGEYVRLDFAAETGQWSIDTIDPVTTGAPFFATVMVDGEGYAVLGSLEREAPTEGDFLTVTTWETGSPIITRVSLPFDRYYLEEGDGGRAEDLVAGRDTEWLPDQDPPVPNTRPTYALVRIHDGEAVIEDLIVGDRSIHEWLKEVASME